MSVKEVQAAVQGEFTDHINARVTANQTIRDATVNLGRPRWSRGASVPVERTKLGTAYLETQVHPPKGVAKIAAQEIACFERACACRNETRLQAYALARVRRDVMESALRSKLGTISEVAT